jgi:hypothetical protein
MTRIQVSGAIVVLLLAAASLCASILRSPDVPFIHSDANTAWITRERPVGLETVLGGREFAPRAAFTREFRIEHVPDSATLNVKALGEVQVAVNGRPLPLPSGDRACFKRACSVAAAPWLSPGENAIRAHVRNPSGPPLLHLDLRGAGLEIVTDEDWQVALDDGAPETAASADDTRPFPESRAGPTPIQALLEQTPLLLALFTASCLIFVTGCRFLPKTALRRLPEATVAVLSVFWVFLFGAKFIRLPAHFGYDAKFHVEYIWYIVDHHALPLASDGFSMYHPPLFYGLAAGLISAFDPTRGTLAEQAVLKLIPFLCGLGMVWVTYGVMRRIFPRDPRPTFFAVTFAGLLPVNVYMSAYVSNEPLLALLIGAALLVAAPLLLGPEKSAGRLVLLGAILGLALMTKYTALIAVPVIAFFLGFELWLAEGVRLRRAAAISASVLVGAILIGGWVYVRNWIYFGDPLIWNLDVPGGLPWWQPPGFRTLDYYLGFGESLRHPFFSLFHSFWDAYYSTTWGDGAPPSIYHLAERHPYWNYDAMLVGYLLALPATALVGIGVLKVTEEALKGEDRRRRSFFTLVAALVFAIFFSIVSLSVRFPFWGALRAPYALAAVVPVAICAGIGTASVDRWLGARGFRVLRALFYGWFGVFAAVLAASFGS